MFVGQLALLSITFIRKTITSLLIFDCMSVEWMRNLKKDKILFNGTYMACFGKRKELESKLHDLLHDLLLHLPFKPHSWSWDMHQLGFSLLMQIFGFMSDLKHVEQKRNQKQNSCPRKCFWFQQNKCISKHVPNHLYVNYVQRPSNCLLVNK